MKSVSVRSSPCYCGCDHKDGDLCLNVWSKLPKDLIIEFLRRLPKEALLEFRCVSKDYNFMIIKYILPKLPVSGHVFQWERHVYPIMERKRRNGTYRRVSPPPKCHYGYVTEPGRKFATDGGKLVKSYLSLLPFVPKPDDFLGCFNGFFLVRNSSSVPIQYYVCNPATRQCLAIPPNSAHVQKDSFAGLAFDPLDPLPHYFKIVRVACSPEKSPSSNQIPYEMDVFSSATGKWTSYLIPLKHEILEFKWNRRSVYVNGVFYLLSMGKYLLCFDLATANDNSLKARAVKLPPRSRDDCIGLFEVSNGCLYYACRIDDDLLVWIFHAGNEISPWSLKYNIRVSASRDPCLSTPHFCKQMVIFAVDLSAEIIYGGSEYWGYMYDLKNNEVDFYGLIDYGIYLYAESLCFYPYSCCLVRLSEQFSLW